MMISGMAPTFALACFGGLLVELLKWYSLRESPNLPAYAKNPVYWAITALMVLAGGGLALLYGTDSKSSLLVVNIGISAPLIIKAFADTKPKTSPQIEDHGPATPGFGFDRRKSKALSSGSIAEFLSWR
jgi:hypothetical protein